MGTGFHEGLTENTAIWISLHPVAFQVIYPEKLDLHPLKTKQLG